MDTKRYKQWKESNGFGAGFALCQPEANLFACEPGRLSPTPLHTSIRGIIRGMWWFVFNLCRLHCHTCRHTPKDVEPVVEPSCSSKWLTARQANSVILTGYKHIITYFSRVRCPHCAWQTQEFWLFWTVSASSVWHVERGNSFSMHVANARCRDVIQRWPAWIGKGFGGFHFARQT